MRCIVKVLCGISLACWLVQTGPAAAMPAPTPDDLGQLIAGDGNYFFYSLQVDGDVAVVGMPRDDLRGANSGSIHFFRHQAGRWIYDGLLTAADGVPGDYFGAAVALQGDTLMVAAPGRSGAGNSSGTVFTFLRVGQKWAQQQRLDPAGDGGITNFGKWITPGGEGMLVGAVQVGAVREQDKAVAVVFLRSGDLWTRHGLLQGVTTSEGSRGAVLGLLGVDAPYAKYEGRRVEINLKGDSPLTQPDVKGCLVEADYRGLWVEPSAGGRTFVPYSTLRVLTIAGPCATPP